MEFSLNEDSFTPIRPQKIEMLFSPCLKASNKSNDTFRVSSESDGGMKLPIILKQYPKQSTVIKPDKPVLTDLNSSLENESLNNITDISASGNLTSNTNKSCHNENENLVPQYKPINVIKSTQPTRATCFHPTGDAYVVGSNSRTMQICKYPAEFEIQSFTANDLPSKPEVLFTFIQTHRGSIYCSAFNSAGDLLATGSNDQTVHIIRYDHGIQAPNGCEYKLHMHTGTVRDICFMKDDSTPILVSGGAGSFEIFVSDCQAMKTTQALRGHESTVMSLYSWNESNKLFYSGSLDGTIRLWDLRYRQSVSTISTCNQLGGDVPNVDRSQTGLPVGVVRVDPTGRLLVSGHQNGDIMLYDIRGGRIIQTFHGHDDDIRTLNFSPKSYYLLTAGYDHKVKLTDIQGNLTRKLPTVDIAGLDDKVVQTSWHPLDYNFLTTCADGTATLWTMPGFCKTT